MPQQAWTRKQERQYEHVKASQKHEGRSEDKAKEIAARTVNKQRARAGQSRQRSRASVEDNLSAPQRGGKRSGSGPGGRTKQQLYEEAKRRGIKGRSTMTKAQLEKAVGR